MYVTLASVLANKVLRKLKIRILATSREQTSKYVTVCASVCDSVSLCGGKMTSVEGGRVCCVDSQGYTMLVGWEQSGMLLYYCGDIQQYCLLLIIVILIGVNILIIGYTERCHNHCFNFNCFRLNLIVLGYFKRQSSISFQKLLIHPEM